MVRIDTVLLKVASRCNISCDYCYIYRMGDTGWSRVPKLMAPETVVATAAALHDLLVDQRRTFAVVLHGGEPLLLGERRLREMLRALRSSLRNECPISIQTNGVLITNRILDICAEWRAAFSVSLDGPQQVHDMHRLGHDGESTFAGTMDGIRRLLAHREADFLFSGVLSVIDPCTDPDEVYTFLKRAGAPSLDFLYRDGNHTSMPVGKTSFESQEYGRWLARLSDLYFADPDPVPVRILDDMTRLILGGSGSKEGIGLEEYGIVVIDTDGRVAKNDTLKSNFDGADRFAANWSVHRNRLFEVAQTEEFREYYLLQDPTSPVCLSCSLRRICGGGMPLTRWRDDNRYDNPSVYCSDHKYVIEHITDLSGMAPP
jgi:uncharacterized protein